MSLDFIKRSWGSWRVLVKALRAGSNLKRILWLPCGEHKSWRGRWRRWHKFSPVFLATRFEPKPMCVLPSMLPATQHGWLKTCGPLLLGGRLRQGRGRTRKTEPCLYKGGQPGGFWEGREEPAHPIPRDSGGAPPHTPVGWLPLLPYLCAPSVLAPSCQPHVCWVSS